MDDVEYRALFDEFVQLPVEGNGLRSPSPAPIEPSHFEPSPQRPGTLERPMVGGAQMSELAGRAPPVAPVIEDSNIQNRYSVVPVMVAPRVNYPSYTSAEQHESAVLPTWTTSGVDILPNDPISSMLLHAPISPFALPNDQPPVQNGDTNFRKQISALVNYNELARTTNIPVARTYLAPERANAPIRPNEAPRQTNGSTMSLLVVPNIVEGASDGSLTGSSEFALARKYARGAPRPTDIPRGPMAPSGGTSTNAVDMTESGPHPVMNLRGLPAEAFEGDVLKLNERLLRKGADPTAVGVCTRIFSEGISIAALEVPMTREESEEHGVIGKRYRMLLKRSTESGGIKNRCRLCSKEGCIEYKNHRDALRHLLKDHFGMGYECKYNCPKVCYTPAELAKHIKISHRIEINPTHCRTV